MDNRKEIRDFLSSRRARVTPEEADLPAFGVNRRVPGLRREEVAMLAGVSVDYYIRLERGDARGASDEVLAGIARALRLDDAEQAHLLDLIRTSDAPPTERQEQVRPAVRRIVDAMSGIPAMVRNRRLDILYANRLGRALYSQVFDNPIRPANPARYVFLDRGSRRFFGDWDRAADDMVALLRSEAGRSPTDEALATLIEELSIGSDEFRTRWTAHDVLLNRTGTGLFHHPSVGDLVLAYEDLVLPEDPGQTVLVFTAEPGSASDIALGHLAEVAGPPTDAGSTNPGGAAGGPDPIGGDPVD